MNTPADQQTVENIRRYREGTAGREAGVQVGGGVGEREAGRKVGKGEEAGEKVGEGEGVGGPLLCDQVSQDSQGR